MKLSDLKRIQKLRHLYQYSEEKLITSLCLYDKVLITTNDIKYIESYDETVPHAVVSKDVQALHKLCLTDEKILLPCPKCSEERPYNQTKAWNPMTIGELDKAELTETPLVTSQQTYLRLHRDEKKIGIDPCYCFGCDTLTEIDDSDFDNDYTWKQFCEECGRQCKEEILLHISELRKDFVCTLNSEHRGFVDFLLFPAVTEEPDELKNYRTKNEEQKSIDPNAIIKKTKEEEMAEELYYEYRDALFLVKVGQYPSLRDLHLFDTQRYRKILGRDYNYYTMALDLYSNGIGIGAFAYLRRILEDLVENIHKECKKNSKGSSDEGDNQDSEDKYFDEHKYDRSSFDEKIKMLEKYYGIVIIPDELTEIKRKIYGVLSKGIHEYTEEECYELFPAACIIIETILNEKISQDEHSHTIDTVKKEFQNA